MRSRFGVLALASAITACGSSHARETDGGVEDALTDVAAIEPVDAGFDEVAAYEALCSLTADTYCAFGGDAECCPAELCFPHWFALAHVDSPDCRMLTRTTCVDLYAALLESGTRRLVRDEVDAIGNRLREPHDVCADRLPWFLTAAAYIGTVPGGASCSTIGGGLPDCAPGLVCGFDPDGAAVCVRGDLGPEEHDFLTCQCM